MQTIFSLLHLVFLVNVSLTAPTTETRIIERLKNEPLLEIGNENMLAVVVKSVAIQSIRGTVVEVALSLC
jgi:hypothetical protein